MNYLDLIRKRRSVYALSDTMQMPRLEFVALIRDIFEESPSAFNMQNARGLILFGEEHARLWRIVMDALQAKVTKDQFDAMQSKLQLFAQGASTIMFFNDTVAVSTMKETYPSYAVHFDSWADQSLGIVQGNVWNALAERGIGANLQHYNPLIDKAVQAQWNVPPYWTLVSQMVCGAIDEAPGPIEKISGKERVLVYG